jgi:hypothetical protein
VARFCGDLLAERINKVCVEDLAPPAHSQPVGSALWWQVGESSITGQFFFRVTTFCHDNEVLPLDGAAGGGNVPSGTGALVSLKIEQLSPTRLGVRADTPFSAFWMS